MVKQSVTNSEPRVIVALDFPDQAKAIELVERLEPGRCRLKVGKEMFTRYGPPFVERLRKLGFEIFLDLKFHDIPNTVAAACDAAADLQVWMMNLHASGGRRMMEAARERLERHSGRPLLVAVTLLTSLAEQDIAEIGYRGAPLENVLRLAALTRKSGLDGVVCSPLEAAEIRRHIGDEFLLVTPGVRPRAEAPDDQRRVMTPGEAIAAGSSYLVVGRPITAAPDPVRALEAIGGEIAGVL